MSTSSVGSTQRTSAHRRWGFRRRASSHDDVDEPRLGEKVPGPPRATAPGSDACFPSREAGERRALCCHIASVSDPQHAASPSASRGYLSSCQHCIEHMVGRSRHLSRASLTARLPAAGERPRQVPWSHRSAPWPEAEATVPRTAAMPRSRCAWSLLPHQLAGGRTRAGVVPRQGTRAGTCGRLLPRLGREPPRRGPPPDPRHASASRGGREPETWLFLLLETWPFLLLETWLSVVQGSMVRT